MHMEVVNEKLPYNSLFNFSNEDIGIFLVLILKKTLFVFIFVFFFFLLLLFRWRGGAHY